MTELYLRVLELLTPAAVPPTDPQELWIHNQLKKIKWIDDDFGQIDAYETRPPVSFPCVLISIDLPRTVTQGSNTNLQQVDSRIRVRLGYEMLSSAAKNVSPAVRSQALEYHDINKAIYLAMQGKKSIEKGRFDRLSSLVEPRADFKVVANSFGTTFLDRSAIRN